MASKDDLKAFDNYLICQEYNASVTDDQGFYRFENDGLFYFAFLEKGQVILRSEGYDNEHGRNNGIHSVQTNMHDDASYSPFEEEPGKWTLSLFAKNNQEIARTCPFSSKEEALKMLPSARLAAQAHHRREDDYLLCSVYESHTGRKSESHKDFICFQDAGTSRYFFAWMTQSGKVILRSEGYPTTAARDKGMESVINNRDDRNNYTVIPFQQHYYVSLKAANHQEIGRSCLLNSEEEFWRLWDEHNNHRVDDDYLVCHEYEKYMSARCSPHNDFICFFHPVTKKYYFAWVTADDKIILRSEGYPTEEARNKGIESVIHHRNNRDNFSVIEDKGVYFLILKALNHKEIGRSCPNTSAAALWALLMPVAPVVAATSPATAAAAGAFNWRWLLPLLLLIPLFFWWRSCQNQPANETERTTNTSAIVSPGATSKDSSTVQHCGLQWILFDSDQDYVVDSGRAELQQVEQLLKGNPTYVVDLKGYTDEKGSFEYNMDLSRRRALNCKQLLLEWGIDSSRIQADAMSETDPAAINTEGDEGRHFNRRVEVYVLDANGIRVCQSIKPDIPYNLRIQQ